MAAKLFAFLFLAFFLIPSKLFALSDSEYNALVSSSPEFKAEDEQLGKIYKQLMNSLKGDDKISLRNAQRKWLKAELDAEARQFMAEGMSKAKAYTRTFHRRYNVLRVMLENSQLNEEDYGRAKADDYYNANEDAEEEKADSVSWPDNCGKVEAAIPVEDSLTMLLLESQNGEKRTFYYFKKPEDGAVDCGNPTGGVVCFQILQEIAVTQKLKEAGVKGDKITLIHQCVVPD